VADFTYDLCKLTPSEISIDVVGIAVEGGRSLSGVTKAINYSGGGFVAATYGGINLIGRAALKEWNKIGAMLNGSVRTVLLPLWADPVAARDGSDNPAGGPGGVDNPTVAGSSTRPAGSTIIKINLSGGTTVIEGGEWFAINHGGALEWRAYRIAEAIIGAPPNDYRISPPLRAAVDPGVTLDFWRPRCLMRLKPGDSLPWTYTAPGATSVVSASFVEAF
jgi:hypothetical protein